MAKEKQIQAYEEKQPQMRRRIRMSKDRQWLIVETIRTDIIHRNYMEAVLKGGPNDAGLA